MSQNKRGLKQSSLRILRKPVPKTGEHREAMRVLSGRFKYKILNRIKNHTNYESVYLLKKLIFVRKVNF